MPGSCHRRPWWCLALQAAQQTWSRSSALWATFQHSSFLLPGPRSAAPSPRRPRSCMTACHDRTQVGTKRLKVFPRSTMCGGQKNVVLSPEASIRRDRRRFGQRGDAEKICAPPQSLTSQQQEKQGRRPLPCSERRTVVPWGSPLQNNNMLSIAGLLHTPLSFRTKIQAELERLGNFYHLPRWNACPPSLRKAPCRNKQDGRPFGRWKEQAFLRWVGGDHFWLEIECVRRQGQSVRRQGQSHNFFFSRLSLARFRRTTPLQKAWRFSFHNPRQSKCSRDQIGHWSVAKGRASIKNCVTIRSNITGHVQCVLGRDCRGNFPTINPHGIERRDQCRRHKWSLWPKI